MSDLEKFYFNLHDFDEDAMAKKKLEEETPPPPTFSEEELEAAKAEAYQKGRLDGIDEERKSINQRAHDTIVAYQQGFNQLFNAENMRNQRFAEDCTALCFDALERVFPLLFEGTKNEEFKAFIQEHLQQHIKSSRIIIRVHPNLLEDVQGRMDEALANIPLEGRWTLTEDPQVLEGQCQIQWENGGVIWHPVDLQHEILQFFKDHLPEGFEPVEMVPKSELSKYVQHAADEAETETPPSPSTPPVELETEEHAEIVETEPAENTEATPIEAEASPSQTEEIALPPETNEAQLAEQPTPQPGEQSDIETTEITETLEEPEVPEAPQETTETGYTAGLQELEGEAADDLNIPLKEDEEQMSPEDLEKILAQKARDADQSLDES